MAVLSIGSVRRDSRVPVRRFRNRSLKSIAQPGGEYSLGSPNCQAAESTRSYFGT